MHFFHHNDLPNIDLYCVQHWVRIDKEGAEEHICGDVASVERVEQLTHVQGLDEYGEVLCGRDIQVYALSDKAQDMENICAMGLDVDDDNECLPENIPANASDSDATESDESQEWGWEGIDHRRQMNVSNVPPSLTSLHGAELSVASYLTMFFLFFPRLFIEDVILVKTNEKLEDPVDLLIWRSG